MPGIDWFTGSPLQHTVAIGLPEERIVAHPAQLPPPPGMSEEPPQVSVTPPVGTLTTPSYTIRELRNDEWDRIAQLPPYPEGPLPPGVMPDPNNSIVMIAETPEGEIIQYWMAINLVHMEGWWTHPDHRKRHPRLPAQMMKATREVLDAAQIPTTFCFSDRPEISDYMVRLGLKRFDNEAGHAVETFLFEPAPCPSSPPPSPAASDSSATP